MNKLGIRSRKTRKKIETVSRAAGWTMEHAESQMERAKESGLSYYQYVSNECWKLDDKEIKRLAEKLNAREQARREEIEAVCKESGWSFDRAEKEMTCAKKDGMSYSHYVDNECWKLNKKEIKELAVKLEELEKDHQRRRKIKCHEFESKEQNFDKEVNRLNGLVRKYGREDDIELTEEQKREIDSFWDQYKFAFSPDYDTFKVNMNRTGKFDFRYLPYGIRRNFLKKFWLPESYRVVFQNKAYLDRIYQNIKQPVVVVRKITGIYYNEHYEKISLEEALDLCEERLKKTEIVIKPSGKQGGLGVVFLSHATRERLAEEFKKIPKLMVVQEAVKQHPFMAKLNPSTVNTVRLTTYLRGEEVVPLAALIKIGNAAVRVDNYKHGGHILGVGLDGHTLPYALNVEYEKVTKLPTGVDLSEGLDIPGFDNVIKTAERAHIQTPQIKLISWDIAIDEHSEAVIIEANHGGDYRMHQAVTGPIFGDMTKEILDQYIVKEFYRQKGNHEFDYREYFDHIELVKYDGFDKKCVTVPRKIDKKPVTVIGRACFAGCEDLTRVILPDSIKSIKNKAFADCSNLTFVTVPKRLSHVGKNSFEQCGKLSNQEEWTEKIRGGGVF